MDRVKRLSSIFGRASIFGFGHPRDETNNQPSRPTIPILNEEILQQNFAVEQGTDVHILKDLKKYVKKRYFPNLINIKRFFLNLFPIIQWLPKYKFKEYFLKDLIGGITLGIVLVPQTMGYSLNGVIF